LVSLGLTWSHLVSLGLTWSHLDSLGLTWSHLVSLGLSWTHLVSLGLTGSHLDSLGFTWSHLDSLGLTWSRLVSPGLTWSHLVSLGLTWSLLESLETMCFAEVLRTSGTNGTGEQHHQRKRTGGRKSNQITPRAHQNTSELVQEAPERPHDLAEPLFKSFRQHSFAPTPKGTRRPEPEEDYSHSRPQPQDHVRRSH